MFDENYAESTQHHLQRGHDLMNQIVHTYVDKEDLLKGDEVRVLDAINSGKSAFAMFAKCDEDVLHDFFMKNYGAEMVAMIFLERVLRDNSHINDQGTVEVEKVMDLMLTAAGVAGIAMFHMGYFFHESQREAAHV